jgi:hypothetical protein
MTEADVLRERAKIIEKAVFQTRQQLDLFEIEEPQVVKQCEAAVAVLETAELQFVRQGEAAVAILLEQARIQEKTIELARLDNELAGKAILNDLTQMQILERTIELRKTELVIAQQIAEAAETEAQAMIEARFGVMGEDPGALIARGGAEGPGATELEQLQLTEDQKFEILNMAFVRETELRLEHAAKVSEINQTILDEARRTAEALVAGGFEVIGRGLGEMIAGTQKSGKDFGKAMQGLVGEAASQFGKFLIVFGVGNVARSLTPPDPTALAGGLAQIAAGTALVALGAAAAAAAAPKPSTVSAAGAGAPRGGVSPAPAPLPEEAPGRGFVINVFAEGDIVDLPAFIENKITPAIADSIGAGNLGSAEFNLRVMRE